MTVFGHLPAVTCEMDAYPDFDLDDARLLIVGLYDGVTVAFERISESGDLLCAHVFDEMVAWNENMAQALQCMADHLMLVGEDDPEKRCTGRLL